MLQIDGRRSLKGEVDYEETSEKEKVDFGELVDEKSIALRKPEPLTCISVAACRQRPRPEQEACHIEAAHAQHGLFVLWGAGHETVTALRAAQRPTHIRVANAASSLCKRAPRHAAIPRTLVASVHSDTAADMARECAACNQSANMHNAATHALHYAYPAYMLHFIGRGRPGQCIPATVVVVPAHSTARRNAAPLHG